MVHLQHLKSLSATLNSWVMSLQLMSRTWDDKISFFPSHTTPFTPLWMGEDNSQVSIYTDNIEKWKTWANRMVINSFSILYPWTSNLASFHSPHQPALTYTQIYMVLCNKKAVIWARISVWGETALFIGRFTGLHGQWWPSDPLSLFSGGQPWHPVHALSSRRYGNNSSTALLRSFPCFWVRQQQIPISIVYLLLLEWVCFPL